MSLLIMLKSYHSSDFFTCISENVLMIQLRLNYSCHLISVPLYTSSHPPPVLDTVHVHWRPTCSSRLLCCENYL